MFLAGHYICPSKLMLFDHVIIMLSTERVSSSPHPRNGPYLVKMTLGIFAAMATIAPCI